MSTLPDKETKQPVAPDELRKFGLLFGTILATLFGLLLPLLFGKPIPLWPWAVSGVFILLAIIYPKSLILAYRPWMKFGAVAGWINTRIILGFLFFLFITPFGLIMRLFGKDLLKQKLDSTATTYRVIHKSHPKEHMEHPY